jgi:HlyD family secretion protein
MKFFRKSAVIGGVIVVIVAAAIYFWFRYNDSAVPEGLLYGNGRIEATEVDIATKFPGRLSTVLVKEGDLVKAGQILARMDTAALESQLKEAQAMVRQAQQAKQYAEAMIAESASQADLAEKEFDRSNRLIKNGSISTQRFDHDQTNLKRAKAANVAAKARTEEARAAIEAAMARVARLTSEIEDGILTSPRDGRVLSRMAEPGEILPSGGKVLVIMDLNDIYMTVFFPSSEAGKIAIGTEARVILDGLPDHPFPAKVTYFSDKAQFTPREVETREERQKLVFRCKVSLTQPEDMRLKPGMTGVSYIRLSNSIPWPGSNK